MIESALDDIQSGFGHAEGLSNTEADPLLDHALELAFAPADRAEDPSCPEPDRTPSFPRMVSDRYRVIEPVACGGQGIIVRVRDTNLGRELALKTIHAELAEDG